MDTPIESARKPLATASGCSLLSLLHGVEAVLSLRLGKEDFLLGILAWV